MEEQSLVKVEQATEGLTTRLANVEKIDSDETFEYVSGLVRAGQTILKEIEARLGPTVKAANDAHKEAVALRKSFKAPVEVAIELAKALMADWMEEKRRQAAVVAEEIEAKGGSKAVAQAVQKVAGATSTEGISERVTWDFEVTSEAKIKKAYMVPDTVKIRQTVRSHGKEAAKMVGGIKVFEKRTVAARSY
jgi:hypothetical protein